MLTFAGPEFVGGSLADGSYTLTVRADRVHDRWGRELDGDGDGSAGGDRADGFFRLFGDSDGDGDVDLRDLGRFLSTLRPPAGRPALPVVLRRERRRPGGPHRPGGVRPAYWRKPLEGRGRSRRQPPLGLFVAYDPSRLYLVPAGPNWMQDRLGPAVFAQPRGLFYSGCRHLLHTSGPPMMLADMVTAITIKCDWPGCKAVLTYEFRILRPDEPG